MLADERFSRYPAADFVGDLILVIMPMRLLWRIKLSFAKKLLLQCIFSASMFTTIVSIIHAVYVFSPNRNGEGILAHIEVRSRSLAAPAGNSHTSAVHRPRRR